MSQPGHAESSPIGPFEWAVVAVVAATASVGALVWAGASLAALVVARPTHVTAAEVARAAPLLFANLSRPASVWSPAVAARLPGPVLYWMAQSVVVILAAMMAWASWTLHQRHGGGARLPLGVRGRRGVGRPGDLGRLGLNRWRRGNPSTTKTADSRITIGFAGRRLIAADADCSLAVVGPTGCGKTAGLAIPALLEWPGPVLATSVKTDLLAATIDRRRKMGDVAVYDPTGIGGQPSAWWDPLATSVTWPGAMKSAAALVEAGRADGSKLADPDYWNTQARKALAPYLHAAALAGRSLTDVAAWVDARTQDEVDEILGAHDPKHVVITAATPPQTSEADQELRLLFGEFDPAPLPPPPTASAARLAAWALWSKERRIRDSVFASLENVLVAWTEPGCGSPRTGSTSIDLDAWLSGPNTLYVVADSHDQKRLRPVLTTVVGEAVRAAFATASASPGGRLAQPCLILLDEAANIAPLTELPAYAATARSHGITLLTVWQDIAQMEAIYGRRAQTVLNNHRAKLFGGGISDAATLDYVSRLCGQVPETERTSSVEMNGGRRSIATRTAWHPAAPSDLVRRLPPGQALLVHAHDPAAAVRLRPWYSNRSLRHLADPDRVRT